ncbi:MAG: UDP-N-acetylglucosamine 2-epimerase [Mahella sp.]|nr:UDP-N-acetylglucosamine 2-epimerase [Mahella sp.]
MRKIAVITGTRADYGIMYYLLKAIQDDPDLELLLIACGMHLSPEFGLTIKEIETDFPIAAKVDTLLSADTGGAMAKSIGIGIIGIAQALEQITPDILVVLGDRGEMLAAATAALHLNIPIAHIHGGEVTGTVDEMVRHAITKLSHIHLAATEDSARRIEKMGEDPGRVFVVGAPGLDYIKQAPVINREELTEKYPLLAYSPVLLMTYHPVTTERLQVKEQIERLMEALVYLKYPVIITYPNADSGGREIVKIIEGYVRDHEFMAIYKNISQLEYINMLRYVDVMIGNSSSGIIEAPSFKLPVVNIGTRQQGRLRACNVIDVGNSKDEILQGIDKALHDEGFRSRLKECINPYGDGNASRKIVDILKSIDISGGFIQKRITY